MRESPRLRRLRSDYRALQQLRSESSVFDFISRNDPPDFYSLRFRGNGVWRPDGSNDPLIHDQHQVDINLGASYPRMQPELAWRSPIFHPNISASGVVCLGGYGTYWVPGVRLDELCTMLWDMIRYQNFDVNSPYNREAAAWAKTQYIYQLPLDARSLRDRIAAGERVQTLLPAGARAMRSPGYSAPDVTFIDSEVGGLEILDIEIDDREIDDRQNPDIFFIE